MVFEILIVIYYSWFDLGCLGPQLRQTCALGPDLRQTRDFLLTDQFFLGKVGGVGVSDWAARLGIGLRVGFCGNSVVFQHGFDVFGAELH